MAVSESSTQNPALRDPDVRLMLEVRDDNAVAFNELMLRYQNRLIALLEHVVGRRELAEELTQEVFLRVYRARKRYEPGAKFSTWLFTIANNLAANALRSQSRRHEVNLAQRGTNSSTSVPTLEQLAQAASGFMPARQFEKAELSDVIRQAMATLNERQRMAVLLSKFESMSYEEIAETMQMSPQAIKSLLSRARSNLREILEPYLESGELKEVTPRPEQIGSIEDE
ncbi:MAG TPA: sigma-70 family RNA polymerase sigma factor [Pirellulales bacterium]|nr:sigma-70 family RNA polymerase sigma factor [Pirellulales bacterium]